MCVGVGVGVGVGVSSRNDGKIALVLCSVDSDGHSAAHMVLWHPRGGWDHHLYCRPTKRIASGASSFPNLHTQDFSFLFPRRK
jgi:hypothetical protein